MSYEVEVKNVERVPIAAIRGRARRENMSTVIRKLFDEFYADPPPNTPRGLNVVYYDYHGESWATADGIPLHAGVQLAAPCEAHGKVECLSTLAGEVATVVHWGDYSKLGQAYDALQKWSKETGRKFAGPFWEVYGHSSDDPAEVRTDVFQLLAK
jgi:effector-binding domain-containing protein